MAVDIEVSIEPNGFRVNGKDYLIIINQVGKERWSYACYVGTIEDNITMSPKVPPFECQGMPWITNRYKDNLLTNSLMKTLCAEKEETQKLVQEINTKLYKLSDVYIQAHQNDEKELSKEELRLQKLHDIANELIKKYHIKTIRADTLPMEEIWIYRDGKYDRNGESIIQDEVLGQILDKTTGDFNQVINFIKSSGTRIDRDLAKPKPNSINVKNGILIYDNSGKIELIPHNPDYNFTYIIPVNYDPHMKCPRITKLLVDILKTEEKIKLFLEFAGNILFTEYKIKKAVICIGKPDTGKTTLLNILNKFTGEKNICSVSLQAMNPQNDKFATSDLDGKLLNSCDELPNVGLTNIEEFKKSVGGSPMRVQRKGKAAYSIINNAKNIYAANESFTIDNKIKNVFFDKIVLLEFVKVFGEGSIDTNIRDQEYSDEEMSGFLNLAIEGMLRLVKNKCYTYDEETTMSIWKKYYDGNSPVQDFIKSEIEITRNPSDEVLSSTLHVKYVEYCIKNKEIPLASKVFGKYISRIDGIEHTRIFVKKQEFRGWKGLIFNNQSKQGKSEPVQTKCSDCGKTVQNFHPEICEDILCATCRNKDGFEYPEQNL